MQSLNNKILKESPFVPILVLCIVLSTLIIIPFKVTGYGFLPTDDALRHTAFAVSGKSWSDILILREGITTDSHPGWHAILRFVHRITRWGTDPLVVFSVLLLFIIFALIPVFMLKRPETWLMSLLAVLVLNQALLMRLFFGRPYILTMSFVLILCLLWPRLRSEKTPYGIMLVMALFSAASTWIHCGWYLFAIVLLPFFLAGETRAGTRLGISLIAGIALGALLTGGAFLFLEGTFMHALRAFGNHQLQRTLVTEFQPSGGDALIAIGIFGMLGWRYMRGAWDKKRVKNPVFILAVIGWILGFASHRFWLDWGMPATCVWMAREFHDGLEKNIGFLSWRRVIVAMVVAGTFFLGITNDVQSRWTSKLTKAYLSQEDPEHREWLPAPGGIVYSDDMSIFYDTFFKNPGASWRYILGFEPTMMPEEDLKIFRNIQWNYGAVDGFRPWVKKMNPKDRLIIRRGKSDKPDMSDLEWYYAATGIWVGRLPRD